MFNAKILYAHKVVQKQFKAYRMSPKIPVKNTCNAKVISFHTQATYLKRINIVSTVAEASQRIQKKSEESLNEEMEEILT